MGRRVSRYGAFIAAAIYLVFGLLMLSGQSSDLIPVRGDSLTYVETASGIGQCVSKPGWTLSRLAGGGFTEEEKQELGFDGWILQHAPLYLFPLGISQAVGGGETGARLVSVLFLMILGGLLYDLGRRLFDALVGAAACLLFLLDPAALTYGTAVLTEVPLACLLVLVAWLLIRASERGTGWRTFALGLGLAALYLGKVSLRPLVPILILLTLILYWKRAGRIRLLASLGGGLAVVLIPWWLGLSLAGLPANPSSDQGVDMMWLYRGNNVHLQGWETVGAGDAFTPELIESVEEVAEQPGKTLRDAYESALFRQIRSFPFQWISLVGRKFQLFWSHPAVKHYARMPLWTMPPWIGFFPLLVLIALFGWLLSWGGRRAWIPGILPLYLASVHAVSHLVSRYNIPAIPLVALYAAALPWILLRGPWMGPWRRHRLGSRGFLLLLGGLVFSVVVWFVAGHPLWQPTQGSLSALSWISTLFGGLALFFVGCIGTWILRSTLRAPGRWVWGFVCAGLLGLVLVVTFRGSDPDWDVFSVRLEKPGDSVVQRLGIDRVATLSGIAGAHLEMDLLRSVSDDFTLEVWINDRLAQTFRRDLGARREDFILDPEIHGVQERHLRILGVLEDHVTGYLKPRYGSRSPGLDGFRRWVRVPLQPEDLEGRDVLAVRLTLTRAGKGAFVELFGDESLPPRGRRVYGGPAFFLNAYELSSYKFRLLAGDPRESEYRLFTETSLQNLWGESQFWDRQGRRGDLSREPGRQTGEYRIRLRVRLPGQHIFRMEGGSPQILWESSMRPGDRVLTPQEINLERARTEDYFDGFLTF